MRTWKWPSWLQTIPGFSMQRSSSTQCQGIQRWSCWNINFDTEYLIFLSSHQYRLTLDSKAKEGQVKGFVVNPRKDDVKVFDFSENDEQVGDRDQDDIIFYCWIVWISASGVPLLHYQLHLGPDCCRNGSQLEQACSVILLLRFLSLGNFSNVELNHGLKRKRL